MDNDNNTSSAQPSLSLPVLSNQDAKIAELFGHIPSFALPMSLISKDILQAAVTGFNKETRGMVGGFLQGDGIFLPEQRLNHFCNFCGSIRTTASGNAACTSSDMDAVRYAIRKQNPTTESNFRLCSDHGGAVEYLCHAHNVEYIAPVWLTIGGPTDRVAVAVFWGGQIRGDLIPGDEFFTKLVETHFLPCTASSLESEYMNRQQFSPHQVSSAVNDITQIATSLGITLSNLYRLEQDKRAADVMGSITAVLSSLLEEASQSHEPPKRTKLEMSLSAAMQSLTDRLPSIQCAFILEINPVPTGRHGTTLARVLCSSGYCDIGPIPLAGRADWLSKSLVLNPIQQNPAHSAVQRIAIDRVGVRERGLTYATYPFKSSSGRLYIWVISERPSEQWYIRQDGLEFSVAHLLKVLSERLSAAFDTFTLIQNLTDEEVKLRETAARLYRASEERDRLIVRASHMISRPIGTLTMASDLLAAKKQTAEESRLQVEGSVAELRRVAGLFQAFERLGSADPKTLPFGEATNCPFVDQVGECIDKMRPYAELMHRGLEVEVGSELRERKMSALIRPSAFDEILENLIHNAVKYSFGGQAIYILIRAADGNGTVDLTNFGDAILLDEVDRVFEKEFRGKAGQARVLEGTGIGLWVARQLAQRAEGDVSMVLSEPYDQLNVRGRVITRFKTTFRFRIPCSAQR